MLRTSDACCIRRFYQVSCSLNSFRGCRVVKGDIRSVDDSSGLELSVGSEFEGRFRVACIPESPHCKLSMDPLVGL